MTAIIPNRSHPARFPRYILDRLALYVRAESRVLKRPLRVLDPFGGVGRLHDLPKRYTAVVTGDLEPEWAACRRPSMVADAVMMPVRSGYLDGIITSPCYGSRMSDHHEACDSCFDCGGTGGQPSEWGCDEAPWCCPACGRVDCPVTCGRLARLMSEHNRQCARCRIRICSACGGSGLSRRYTYRHALGRMPSQGSAAVMQWGDYYRTLHRAAWVEALRVLHPFGLMLVNVKNHVRKGAEQRVVEWHAECLTDVGFDVVDVAAIPAPGLRHGENHQLRVEVERLIVARSPLR